LQDALDGVPAGDDWLHQSEYERLQALKRPERFRQYRVGHWLARTALSAHFGGDPRAYTLVDRRGLPPEVSGPAALSSLMYLSITHSGDWIAVAVSADRVGIDIEQRPRTHALDQVESLLLAEGEAPGSIDADGLLMRWVAKEALVKRDCGEALPGALRAMKLLPATADAGHVVISASPEFYFGLASRTAGSVRWLSEPPERVECSWCVAA